MVEKRKKVYEALVEGATQGHSDSNLYDFVRERCPKTSSKKIVRASLLALAEDKSKRLEDAAEAHDAFVDTKRFWR